ncbi:MAG TPA: DUF1223 domain-containing protein [Terracidiphilus sp.]|nr:DUF1223 domain-containing protein [Terracidiphilus sp.]
MSAVVKFACCVLIASLASNSLRLEPSARAQGAPRQPVLVELFTSEGCSDCPPADALLGALDAQQFVPGAQAIVLSEHVTYWNHEGWRDPFSFIQMDDRQQLYARQFDLSDVYTPQAVVDGAQQLVGNDPSKLRSAIAHAAAAPKVNLIIESAHRAASGAIDFSVRADSPRATLVAAIAENATSSQVSRGENAGRTLHHVAVVRVLKEFGKGHTDGQPLELSGANLIAAEKTGTPLRLVVFLVNSGNGHIVGAAEQVLNPSPAATAEQTSR